MSQAKFEFENQAKSLPKVQAGGEWDDGFEAAGPEEDVPVDEPEVEQSDESEGEDSEEPEQSGEPEEDSEELEASEPENEQEEAEQVAQEPEGSRASKRIRQLAAQKKAAEDRLAQLLEQMQASQAQDLALRQAQWQAQERQRIEAQQRAEKEAQFQALQAQGLFDPTSKADQFALTLFQDVQAMQAKLQAQEQALQRAQHQAQWQQYHANVDQSLRAALSKYDVNDMELARFHEQVVAVAVANQIGDTTKAVEQVVSPFLRFLTPKKQVVKKQARVLTEDEKQAHRAVATRAPAGTKKKGQRAGGTQGRKSFKDALDSYYGEREWG